MENEERAQLEAHYQNEIESIKGEVTRLTNLLEQVLSSKNKKRDFCTTSCENTINPHPRDISKLGGRFNDKTIFCAYRPYPVKSSSHHRGFNSRWTPWQ
jgi:hypothetical protein